MKVRQKTILMFKKVLAAIILILFSSATILLINTLRFQSRQMHIKPIRLANISSDAVPHLSRAISFETNVGFGEPLLDSGTFRSFHRFLKESYPLVDQHLQKMVINELSLLYEWKGENPELTPVILGAHLDVEPARQYTLGNQPLGNSKHADLLVGSGAFDGKASLMAIFEAVEHLLSMHFVPNRTIYLAFGHDQKSGGMHGAQAIAAHFRDKGVYAACAFVDGSFISNGLIAPIHTDVALVGTAEKGFATFTIDALHDEDVGIVPSDQIDAHISGGVQTRLQKKPFPFQICVPVQQFIRYAGPEIRFQEKFIFANSTLFINQFFDIYSHSATSREMLQTTMKIQQNAQGVTRITDNSKPTCVTIEASILPGTTILQVIQHLQKALDGMNVEIELQKFCGEPSQVASINSPGFQVLNQSIREVFPQTIVVPGLVTEKTDGRHYDDVAEDVYRFSPLKLTRHNVRLLNTSNEQIDVKEFEDAIQFYIQLIRNSAGAGVR
jgi:carboxypeptidase PM20D1